MFKVSIIKDRASIGNLRFEKIPQVGEVLTLHNRIKTGKKYKVVNTKKIIHNIASGYSVESDRAIIYVEEIKNENSGAN